jgi:hypothetical protein
MKNIYLWQSVKHLKKDGARNIVRIGFGLVA